MSAAHPPAVPPSLLFVYGTLLARDDGQMGTGQRQRLAIESRWVGEAFVRGRLYDLGSYPGLVVEDAGASRVLGDVVDLAAPGSTFAWLDAYEGIVPGDHPHNEYERRLIEVQLRDGSIATAWAYVYRQPVADKPQITSGRWLFRLVQP